MVRSGMPWVSLGSFAFIWFARLDSSGCALWVAGFVRVRLLRLSAHRLSLGSFRFILFFRVRPGCRYVRSGTSGLFGCALEVAGFVQIRMDRSVAPW